MDPFGQARSTLKSALDQFAPWTLAQSKLPASQRPIIQSSNPVPAPVAKNSFTPTTAALPSTPGWAPAPMRSQNTTQPTFSMPSIPGAASTERNVFSPALAPTGVQSGALNTFLANNTFDAVVARQQAQFDQQQSSGQMYAGGGGPVGTTVNGQRFGQFDAAADADIAAAAAKWGIPANFMKAMVARESSGDWQGNAYSVASVRGGARIFGYTGVFYDTARAWGYSNPAAAEGNRAMQLDMMGNGLRRLLDQSPNHDLRQVANMYFSGTWEPTGYVDELGSRDSEYSSTVMSWYNALNASSGVSGQTGWTGGGGAVQTMFGGRFTAPDWGAFGAPSDNGLYGYGIDYGLNGVQHTGLDVPLDVGSPLYAPGNARVICAGTSNGIEGCGAFNDYFGRGAGRIELELQDGTRVIYGHSSTSSVRPGQTVSAGTLIGTSGGMNSPHTHLEVRVPDPRMRSGYRVVDPVQYFGGYVGGGAAPQQPQIGLSGIRTADDLLAFFRQLGGR